jgi:hypothetical protein
MLDVTRLGAIAAAMSLAACSGVESINWTAKLQESDRLSSIKGMLGEVSSFEEQLDLMRSGALPTLNQVDALLALDRTSLGEAYAALDAKAEEGLDALSDLRAAYQDEFNSYIDITRANKEAKEPESLKGALTQLLTGYQARSAALRPALEAKLKVKMTTYAEALIMAYGEGDPCRHFELVDALRRLGNALIAADEAFKSSALYGKIVNDVLLKSLRGDIQQPPRTALTAVGTLEAWQVKDHLPKYIELMEDEKLHYDLRDAVIKLITSFSAQDLAAHKGALVKILNTPPELQPISYIAKAASALGEMGHDEVVERLVECLWLDDARGRNATSECRLALNRLDPSRVRAAALKAFKRQVPSIEERALNLSYAHTGLIEAKAAELLGDVSATESVDFLVRALNHEDVNPAPFAADAVKATFFTKGQVQKTISIAHSLAVLGDVKGVAPLMKIIGNDAKLFEYKLAAAQQLAYLGSDSPVAELLKVFDKKLEQLDVGNRDLKVQYGKTSALVSTPKDKSFKAFSTSVQKSLEETQSFIKQTEEQIAQAKEQEKKLEESIAQAEADVKALKASGVKMPALPAKEKVAKMDDKEAYKKAKEEAAKRLEEAMKAYDAALTDDQKKLRALEAQMDSDDDKKRNVKNLAFEVEQGLKIYKTWEDGFKEIQAQLAVISECGADQGAWARKLSNQPLPVRAVAAYTLSRKSMDAASAARALAERLVSEEDAAVRDVLLFGLARHATKAQLDALKAARDSYEDRRVKGSSDPSLKGTVYSLDLLIAALGR